MKCLVDSKTSSIFISLLKIETMKKLMLMFLLGIITVIGYSQIFYTLPDRRKLTEEQFKRVIDEYCFDIEMMELTPIEKYYRAFPDELKIDKKLEKKKIKQENKFRIKNPIEYKRYSDKRDSLIQQYKNHTLILDGKYY